MTAVPHWAKVTTSSTKMDWRTPLALFDKLDDVFDFSADLFASDDNHLCDNYFTKENSAFNNEWFGTCFANPEYGRSLGGTLAEIKSRCVLTCSVVCLLPARTATKYWADSVWNGASFILFLFGRLHFDGAPCPAPFDSAVVGYNTRLLGCHADKLRQLGHLVTTWRSPK